MFFSGSIRNDQGYIPFLLLPVTVGSCRLKFSGSNPVNRIQCQELNWEAVYSVNYARPSQASDNLGFSDDLFQSMKLVEQ